MKWPKRLLLAIALLPLVVALRYVIAMDAQSPGAVLNALGRLAGIGGLSFLLVAGILSSRVPGFDRYFGGLTKLWRTHHLLGAVSFLLLLAHPLLLSLAASEVSLQSAARSIFTLRLDWELWSGWAALAVLMIVLAPSFSFFGEPNYQRWRWLHRLTGVAIIAAIAHTFLGTRTIPEPLNSLIWATLSSAAIGAVAYRFVFSRHIGRLTYSVAAVSRPANNIVELELEPFGRRRLEYQPGQFVYMAPYDSNLPAGRAEEHPYTLSSSPEDTRLRIAIKALGDATRAIQGIRLGSEVRIEGPYGDFFRPVDRARPELWVAGGIGIAPFLARARHMKLKPDGVHADAHLLYCVQDEARAPFADELRALASCVGKFRFTMHYFYREGPLQRRFLDEQCPDFMDREAYICGPPALNALVITVLSAACVPRPRIHTEEFTLL